MFKLRPQLLAAAALIAIDSAQPISAQTVTPQAADSVRAASRRTLQPDTATKVEIYGFAQGDALFDFRRNNPDWFDVNRPSRLPSTREEFGSDKRFAVSARQSRF